MSFNDEVNRTTPKTPEELTPAEIIDIVEMFANGNAMTTIAIVHMVTPEVVKEIVNGRMFQDVSEVSVMWNSSLRRMREITRPEREIICTEVLLGASILTTSRNHYTSYDIIRMITNGTEEDTRR